MLNLSSLLTDHKSITFNLSDLAKAAERCIIADDIDKRIAACLIGIKNELQN